MWNAHGVMASWRKSACTICSRTMDRSTSAHGDGLIAASAVARSLTWVIEQTRRIAANAVTANQRKGNARNDNEEQPSF